MNTRNAESGKISSDAGLKLLTALSAQGAYGAKGEAGGRPRILVAAPRRGASVCAGTYPVGAAVALASSGLARWETGAASGRERLSITPEGRAHLARRSPPSGGDPFLAQHRPLARRRIDPDEPGPGALVDAAESPLAWLATRKGPDGKALIDPMCLEAGERLRRDLTSALILPRVTANWSAAVATQGRGGAEMGYSDLAIAARQRVGRALDAVGGDFSGLLVDICGFLKGLETVERERGWPRRSAKVALVLALRQLARHYGLRERASGPRVSRGITHWGAPGYRPAITPDEPDR